MEIIGLVRTLYPNGFVSCHERKTCMNFPLEEVENAKTPENIIRKRERRKLNSGQTNQA